MAVAEAVLYGKADTGLGIRSAANALGLDFVPLVEERYDLLIPGEYWDEPIIQAVSEVIDIRLFRKKMKQMG